MKWLEYGLVVRFKILTETDIFWDKFLLFYNVFYVLILPLFKCVKYFRLASDLKNCNFKWDFFVLNLSSL